VSSLIKTTEKQKRIETVRKQKQVNNKQLVQWQNVVDRVKTKTALLVFCSTQHNLFVTTLAEKYITRYSHINEYTYTFMYLCQ